MKITSLLILFLAVFPAWAHAQGQDYLPADEGTNWKYTITLTDIPEEFSDMIPAEIVQRDTLTSIEETNLATIYTISSAADSSFMEDENSEFEESDSYGWFVRNHLIGPDIAFEDWFEEEEEFDVMSPESVLSTLASPAQFFDTVQMILPMYDFSTQTGSNWEIISFSETMELTEDMVDEEEEELANHIDSVTIALELTGSRQESSEVTVDGTSVESEVFTTYPSLKITFSMSEEFQGEEIEVLNIEDYSITSYWAQGYGLVRNDAEPHTIDINFPQKEGFEWFEDDDLEIPEEFTIPGFTRTMSEFEEGDETSAEHVDSQVPEEISLLQNYPNPFNPVTTIEFELNTTAPVQLEIYDINGRHITTLLNDTRQAGLHRVQWNASGMTSGLYMYRLKAGEQVLTNEMMLLR